MLKYFHWESSYSESVYADQQSGLLCNFVLQVQIARFNSFESGFFIQT